MNLYTEHTAKKIYGMTCEVLKLIEEITGEMSQQQKNEVGSTILAFWAAAEDKLHPRDDGKTWVKIIRDFVD